MLHLESKIKFYLYQISNFISIKSQILSLSKFIFMKNQIYVYKKLNSIFIKNQILSLSKLKFYLLTKTQLHLY